MRYETLSVDLRDRVATVRMNRSESMNALEYQLRVDLVDCLRRNSENDEIRAVILTGIGKAFSAGGDLRELGERMTIERAREYILHVSQIVLAIQNLKKPLIAAVNGAALGAGFSMVMASDLAVVSKDALFSMAFIKVGLVPDLGGTYFVPRLIGLQKAKELAFLGGILNARELVDLGIVNYVVPHDDLEDKAFDLARQIAEAPPIALGLTKKLLNQSWSFSLDEMIELEAQSQATCMQTKDFMEGITAFYEKRKCQFKGK